MSEQDFWERIKEGCRQLGIRDGTYRAWRHRNRVSRDQVIPLYQTLKGTNSEIPLEQFHDTKS